MREIFFLSQFSTLIPSTVSSPDKKVENEIWQCSCFKYWQFCWIFRYELNWNWLKKKHTHTRIGSDILVEHAEARIQKAILRWATWIAKSREKKNLAERLRAFLYLVDRIFILSRSYVVVQHVSVWMDGIDTQWHGNISIWLLHVDNRYNLFTEDLSYFCVSLLSRE